MAHFTKPAEGSWTQHFGIGTEPVSYEDSISPEHYELERDAIFRRTWLNVGRVEQVPKKGNYFTRELDVARTSVIIVRGAAGEVRAFHNICRHRGNKLVWNDYPREEVSGSCRQFTCKYHGWRYGIDGALTFVQQEDEFFDLDEKGLRTRVSNSASPWTPARQWQHYAIGARHLYAVWQTGHNVAVRGVLHNLNPDFGAWASGFVPRTGPRVSRQPVCAPEQTQLVVRDSLGPSGVFALLMAATAEQAVSPVEEAWTLAVQLTEDQLQMYGPTLTPGVSQAQWLSDAAQDGMCAPAPGSSPPEDPTEAGVDGPDGAPPWLTLEAGADAARPSRDARGRDAAVRDAGARDAAASDAAVPDRDAAGVEPQLPSDAATPEPDPDDPRTRLVPGGPVWASWAFGFENAEAAQRVASLVGRFEHMHVELDSARVTLRVTEASPSGALLSKWAKQSLCSP